MVKDARGNKGWTQEYLAERVGKGTRHISGIENNGKSPSYEVLQKLVLELNLNPEVIFFPENPSQNSERNALARLTKQLSDGEIRVILATVEAMLREVD